MDGLLGTLGVVHSYAKKKGSIITSGVDSLQQYLARIGFSNPHHLFRVKALYPELVDSD